MEGRVPVVLQVHLDMVHQKNADTDFDFESQGIRMFVDGDWVKAAGTTLGADNGIGVAAIMAILAADAIQHPAIEALFTIGEESGMAGATGLRADVLSGGILLNLIPRTTPNSPSVAPAPSTWVAQGLSENGRPRGCRLVCVKGLTGGHSA
jgi:dipeptidase D